MEYKTIGELCTVKGGKRLPKGEVLVDYKTKHPYVRISDFNHDSIDKKKVKYLTDDVYEKIKNYIINTGDIFLSIVGTIGLVDIINEDLDFSNLTENAVKISSNDNRFLLTEYLYYYLKSPQGQHEINIRTVGSTQPKLAIKRIRDIPIPIVNISEQQTIVSILKNIDGKMKVNQEIIANLEELSQTLFKRWFVDFEFPDEEGNPYKSNGGKFVNSELGQIPIGWNIRELKDIAHIVMGQSPKSDTYNYEKEGLPLINGATDFNHGIINPTKYTTDPKKVGSQNDYIFGVRATIGRVTELDSEYAIGRGAGIASPINEFYREFLYQILNKAFKEFSNTASGSVYLNVSRNDLNSYNIIIPTDDILRAFHSLTNSYLKDISLLKLENKNLTELRDTLLPKLMSGEIELPDELEVDEHAELLQ